MGYFNLLSRMLFGCVLLPITTAEARADDFILMTGAQIRGEWLNRDDALSPVYLVATEYGGRVQLERSHVAQVIPQSEAQLEYDRLAPAVADTVDEHWKLAMWCQAHELVEQGEQHLIRVTELDPDHDMARRALGYSEIGGQWVRKNEHLARQGYVRYKGKWRLSQEIELAEQRQALEIAKKDWYVKLSRWRSQLAGDKRQTALEGIRQLHDPLAVEAIGRMLQEERDRQMRLMWVEALGRIADDQASAALLELALSDRDEEVYYACIEQLAARKTPPLVRQFVIALASPRNDRVNRAAIALGSLGDQSVVPPLIDALVTGHEIALPGSNMISSTFVKNGPANQAGDSFATGSTPQAVTQMAMNQEVLKTLVKLTGVSFSFDQRAWRNWYSVQQRRGQSPAVDARRID